MSNRDRIARAAQEAEAANQEKRKKAASESKPRRGSPTPRSSRGAPAGRVRAVWVVCDHTGATIAVHAYPKEAEAHAEAERLTEATGRTHFVKPDHVPIE